MTRSRLALLPAVAVLAAAGAGCGSSSTGGGDTDPAGFAPAASTLYGEVVVRPDEKQRGEVAAVAEKVLSTNDPGGEIVKLIDRALKDQGHDATYANDVDPWLGDRIGVAMTSLSGATDAVVIVASKDDAKARSALGKLEGDYVERSYNDVDYRFDRKDSSAYAVLDHAVLAGTEAGLKAAIDAHKGDSLAESDKLENARDKVSDERLGLLYLDVEGLLRAASTSAGANPQTAALLQTIRGSLPKTLAAAIDADADAITIDAVSLGTPDSATSGGSGADALAALPADAWLGLGIGDLGHTLGATLDGIASSGGLGGVGVEALLGQIKQQTGIDLRADVLSWIGDAGVFVAGTSLAELRGGLIIQSKDPAATKRTLEKLGPLLSAAAGGQVSPLSAAGVEIGYTIRLSGAPPISVALAGKKLIVVAGRQALRDAMATGDGLGASAEVQSAAAKLGDGVRPSFFLSLAQVTQLLESVAGGQPEFEQAKRYLDAFGAVVAGGKSEGSGVTRARIVVTLR